MFLKNRSTAVSITDEDISAITNRFQVVYAVVDSDVILINKLAGAPSLPIRSNWPAETAAFPSGA
jgi:hypothetical protein